MTAFELDTIIEWRVFAIRAPLVCTKVVMILVCLPVYHMASSVRGTIFLVSKYVATAIIIIALLQASTVSLVLTMSPCHLVSIIFPVIQSGATIFCWFVFLIKFSGIMKVSYIWFHFSCFSILVMLVVIIDVATVLGMLEELELSETMVCWSKGSVKKHWFSSKWGIRSCVQRVNKEGHCRQCWYGFLLCLSVSSFMCCSRITSMSLFCCNFSG